MPASNDPISTDCTIRYHVVAYLDILGQSAELENWNSLTNESTEAELREILPRTLGRVDGVRKNLCTIAREMSQISLPRVLLERLSPDKQTRFLEMAEVEYTVQYFSDTVIVFSPLRHVRQIFPLKEVFGLLSSAALTVLLSLSAKVPVRGAIEIGLAANAFPNECYGPVMSRVARLEKNAEYPRILVGRDLMELIAEISGTAETAENEYSVKVAQRIKSLVILDENGDAMVDMLGPAMRRYARSTRLGEAVERARAFVNSELDRFTQIGDAKLVSRYARLKAYMDRNPDPWPKPSNQTPRWTGPNVIRRRET
jgi:hypothetical protein